MEEKSVEITKSLPAFPGSDIDVGSNDSVSVWILNSFVDGVLDLANCELPPWWSKKRDKKLRNLSFDNEYLAGVLFTIQTLLYNINYQIMAKDSTIVFHNTLAQKYNDILRWSLHNNLEKFILDLLVTDNGGFLFIEGEAPSSEPLNGMPYGLTSLDSLLCTRTRNETYPVVLEHPNGKKYPLHKSRVIFFAQSPSSDWKMNGVGLSSVSRLNMLATHLQDVGIYDLEKYGSLESNRILFASGASRQELEDAINRAKISSTNKGLKRRGKTVYMSTRDPAGKLQLINLKEGESGANKRIDIETTITLMAMTLGIQPYLLLESTQSSSTRNSARESIKLANSKLINWYYKKIVDEITLKFLPPSLMISLEGKDEDVDGTKSRIYLNRSLARKNNLALDVTNTRVERETMMRNGELTQIQFEQLELEDGRLPNGLHISTLFYDQSPSSKNYLRMDGLLNPLDIKGNNSEKAIAIINEQLMLLVTQLNASRSNVASRRLLRAIYALQWLEDEYQLDKTNIDIEVTTDVGNVQSNTQNQNTVQNPTDATGSPNFDNTNAESEMPRDTSNENNVQAKHDHIHEDWLYEALSGNSNINTEYIFTKVGDRRFQKSIREPVRGLWSGELTKSEFTDLLSRTIKTNLSRVYSDIVKKESGVAPNMGQVDALDEQFNRVDEYTDGFADYILQNKKGEGKLSDVYKRADLWIEMKNETEELAKLDESIDNSIEYIWRLGDAEHCDTCLSQENIVKTKAEWNKLRDTGIYPKSRGLECAGYNCKCSLEKI